MRGVVLKYAILAHANLSLCDLRDADLEQADMHRTLTDGAKLGGAVTTRTSPTDGERAKAEDFKTGAEG